MKLSHALTLVGLGVGAAGVIAAAQGCSSSDTTTGGDPSAGREPQRPSAPATTVTAVHNYALHKLFLGDTDRAGTPNSSAWKKFGYNIDGKVSSSSSTDVCTLASSAAKATQADGENGIDNSFGLNIMPIITGTAGADASKRINDSINDGSFTVMVHVTGLDDTSATQTNTGLKALLLAGGKFDETAKPTWTTADNWPVRPEILNSPTDPLSTKVRFDDAYRVNGTFVSGGRGQVSLSIAISGVSLDIVINQAVLTFDVKSKGKATNGVIAGIIDTEELIKGLQKVAGRISTSLCASSAFDNIAAQIRQASDIMADGSNGPGKSCNGISVGLGFESDEIGIPQKVGTLGDAGADPCTAPADAGTD